MKKLSLSFLVLLLALGSAMAQHPQKSKAIYQEVAKGVPEAVLKAIEKDIPGFKFTQLPPLTAAIQQAQQEPDEANLRESYTLRARYINNRGSSLPSSTIKTKRYTEKGEIISSREVLKNNAFPMHVLRTIGKEYNGWLMVRNKTVIKEKGPERIVFYDAVLKKGNERKHILLNEEGVIVKNRKAQQPTIMVRQ